MLRAASAALAAALATASAAAAPPSRGAAGPEGERPPPAATEQDPRPAAPRADPDAIREVRRGGEGRFASARAISAYLDARRCERAGDGACTLEHLRLAVTYDEQSPELRVSLAEALALAGQLDPAEAEARRAIALAPAGPSASGAYVLLGRIAAARRDTERAVLAFKSAIRIEVTRSRDGTPPDPDPWRLLASLYADGGDEEAAVRALDDLASRSPGDSTGFRELGRAYLDRHQPGRAERHLRRAVQLDRRDVEALRLLALAHEALRRDPDARDDLVAILRVDPDDGGALLSLGRMAVHQGDAERAREWFHRYVRAAPERTDAWVRVVFQWLEGGRGADALAAARAGLDEAGSDVRLRFAEGLALQELRRWGESAQVLATIRSDSGELYVSARAALADALSRAGRHGEAERSLDVPLAARPGDLRLVTMRAAVLDRAGRAADAVALLRRMVADRERAQPPDPDLPELYAALAESLAHAGRPAEAVELLRGALGPRPRDEAILYALGVAYDRAGQQDAALAQMRALLAVSPDHPEALNFVGYAYAEQGVRLEEAEKLVRRALELKPRSGQLLDSLGWVLFRRGEARRAVEVLEQAESLAGPDATILEHLGDAYRAAARPGDAAQAYRRALASVPDELPSVQVARRAALERKLREVERASRR